MSIWKNFSHPGSLVHANPIPKSQIAKPICFINPKQPQLQLQHQPPTTSTMGCQAIAWFWRNLWVPVPFSLQTCVLKLVGLGSKQPWNAWPAPMVSWWWKSQGKPMVFLSLKKAFCFLGGGVALAGEYPQNSHDISYKDDLLGHYDMLYIHVFFKVVWGLLWTFTCYCYMILPSRKIITRDLEGFHRFKFTQVKCQIWFQIPKKR